MNYTDPYGLIKGMDRSMNTRRNTGLSNVCWHTTSFHVLFMHRDSTHDGCSEYVF